MQYATGIFLVHSVFLKVFQNWRALICKYVNRRFVDAGILFLLCESLILLLCLTPLLFIMNIILFDILYHLTYLHCLPSFNLVGLVLL